jgi:hypothetical protein
MVSHSFFSLSLSPCAGIDVVRRAVSEGIRILRYIDRSQTDEHMNICMIYVYTYIYIYMYIYIYIYSYIYAHPAFNRAGGIDQGVPDNGVSKHDNNVVLEQSPRFHASIERY